MSARIRLTGSAVRPAEFILRNDVVRFGGDPACDVVIPQSPARWFTLQKQNGVYLLHNRSSESLRLGRARIAPGDAPVAWTPGVTLTPRPGIAMELLVDGHLPPEEFAEPWEDAGDDAPPDEQKAEVEEERGVGMHHLAILAVCGLLIGLMLVDVATTTPEELPRGFEQIVAELADSAEQGNPVAAALTEALQEARYYERRGDFQLAGKLYGFVRDDMLTNENNDRSQWSTVDQHVYEYVRGRLQELPGPSFAL